MRRSLVFLVISTFLYGFSPLAAARSNHVNEELQRKYEAALQEIERLRNELARSKEGQAAGPVPVAPAVAGAPSGVPGSTNLMRVHRIGDPAPAAS